MGAVDYARLHEAPRFYIEGEFCLMVINRMRAGKPMGVTGEARVRKFRELYSRFLAEKERLGGKNVSTLQICNIIVEQPAPEFYISNRSARAIIKEQRELQCREMLRRLRR